MMEMSISPKKPKIIVVLGPTASGKSALAVELARFLGTPAARKRFGISGAEIISADSRQVYKGMDIGTGKVPILHAPKGASAKLSIPAKAGIQKSIAPTYRGIPHHLLDVASPKTQFTVVDYRRLARAAIKKIAAKNKIPIVCGGTGFYIDAALYNYALPEVKADPKLRRALDKNSAEELFKQLQALDPERAGHIDRYNKRRLIRALEIVLLTGRPVPPPEEAQSKISPYDILEIGVRPTDDMLKTKIKARLLKRMRQGMIEEVRRLHDQGISWQRLDDFGLEYRFVSRYLRGIITKEAMVRELERAIRHYAKRQITWFKRDREIGWIRTATGAEKAISAFLRT